ncbi:serine hydrolase FSH [Protomyces lactucae-debilis]|uniref:Serine hydrolase FSH n=1 Tax=Protomyces lactucae-debilis TaxID=2754530 RepID=A0A1Y2FI79_PROLT|nr:serine hydrolase FSH [Protomyces lactucae-debilis]ORY82525.1 serine hydrolase FSH [Protomyces lactucae-debilis]
MAKILCLHGFGQSGGIFQAWTKQLCADIESNLPGSSFYFPTAHITLSPNNSKDLSTIPVKMRGGPLYAWNHNYLDWQRQFSGLEAALQYLKGILETEGPFDGIIGFSQGAAYGVALASLLENPALAAECNLPLIAHPAFKFAVLFSGCKVPTFRFAPLYRDITTPCLLYYCIGDKIIPNRWSMALASDCRQPVVQTHREGHRVPLEGRLTKLAAIFVVNALGSVSARDIAPAPMPCVSDWLSLMEEVPLAFARL